MSFLQRYTVDPEGWTFHLFGFTVCKFGPKYAAKNSGKKYTVQFTGRLWRF